MRFILHSLLLSSLFLAACGGDSESSSTGGEGGSGGSGAPSCTESSVTADLKVKWLPSGGGSTLASWQIAGVLDGTNEASVLLLRDTEDKAKELAFLNPDGTLTPLVKVPEADGYAFDAAPVAMPNGKRCAVYVSGMSGSLLQLACDDGTSESSGLKVDTADRGPGLIPVVDSGGMLHLIASTFASFTEVRRTPAGEWFEREQSESSISWPEDGMSFGPTAIACFINASGHAVVRVMDGGEVTSVGKAKSCQIAYGEKAIHVLLDTGVASIPTVDFNEENGTFSPKPPGLPGFALDMAVVGGEPVAVMLDPTGAKITRVALGSGTATDLDSLDDAYTYRARFDADAGALTVASWSTDTSGDGDPTQSIRIARYCTAKW